MIKKSQQLGAVFGVVLLGTVGYGYYHRSYQNLYQIGNNLCKQNTLATIAQKHGIAYQVIDNFEMPAIKISGKAKIIQKIEQEFEQYYSKSNTLYYYNQDEPECHLSHAKLRVANVNQKLLPYIPNDVDYVSYNPKADKAVYCYYASSNQGGSRCHFVALEHRYGTTWLEEHDISDMERANLSWTFYNFHKGKTVNDLYNVYSFVAKWHNQPHLPYGFVLATKANGSLWLGGADYY